MGYSLTGLCYHNGATFMAKMTCPLSKRKGTVDDPHLNRLLEEAFNFLLSRDSERMIAGRMVQRGIAKNGNDMVQVQAGGVIYQITRSNNNPGSASLTITLPFTADTQEVLLDDDVNEEQWATEELE